ncbi:unnamed protein product, partial [Protopolystoma xenopodis]
MHSSPANQIPADVLAGVSMSQFVSGSKAASSMATGAASFSAAALSPCSSSSPVSCSPPESAGKSLAPRAPAMTITSEMEVAPLSSVVQNTTSVQETRGNLPANLNDPPLLAKSSLARLLAAEI